MPNEGRPRSVDEIVAAFTDAWTPAVRVVAVSHVLTTTGLVMPIGKACIEATAMLRLA